MEIRLLGTGSAEGWPGLFCNCPVCQRSRKIGGKNLRTRSTALINGVLKIDFPPDTLHHVLTQNLDLTQVKYLLITHGHDDHLAIPELQYMSWMFVPEPSCNPLQVFAPADVVARVTESLDLSILPMNLRCLDLWETIRVDGWSITPILAQHDPTCLCFNYILSDGHKTLLYATDTGWYERQTWRFLETQKIDGIVIECAKGPVEGGYMAHLSVSELLRMRDRLIEKRVIQPNTRIVTTHHSHLGGLLHEELEALLNPHGIEVGYDGKAFEI